MLCPCRLRQAHFIANVSGCTEDKLLFSSYLSNKSGPSYRKDCAGWAVMTTDVTWVTIIASIANSLTAVSGIVGPLS